jgi:hypothetical protein
MDTPLDSVPAEELVEHIKGLREYVRNASDPNETGPNGRTCVSLALSFCGERDGVDILRSLLAKGGDPNRPTAVQNFITYTLVAKTTSPLALLISSGLDVNQIGTATGDSAFTGNGPFTMLDYALNIRAYLKKKRKSLSALANEHVGSGSFGARRQLIDDTIALLQAHGAKSASELV